MATMSRLPNAAGQFVLPLLPAGVAPALAAAVEAYRKLFVTDDSGIAWDDAARAVHAIQPASTADLAAKLIVALHYRDPEIVGDQLAIGAPNEPADRFGVEIELACLDALLFPESVVVASGLPASVIGLALAEHARIDAEYDAFEITFNEAWAAYQQEANVIPHATTTASYETGDGERFSPSTDTPALVRAARRFVSDLDDGSILDDGDDFNVTQRELVALANQRDLKIDALRDKHQVWEWRERETWHSNRAAHARDAVINAPVTTFADLARKVDFIEDREDLEIGWKSVAADIRRLAGDAA